MYGRSMSPVLVHVCVYVCCIHLLHFLRADIHFHVSVYRYVGGPRSGYLASMGMLHVYMSMYMNMLPTTRGPVRGAPARRQPCAPPRAWDERSPQPGTRQAEATSHPIERLPALSTRRRVTRGVRRCGRANHECDVASRRSL